MFTRFFKSLTGILGATVCAMGLFVTASADADDHKGGKHRRDSHQYHRDHRDYDRHRGHQRSNWVRRDYRSYHPVSRWDDRRPVRYVRPYWNHRCDDHRHYGYSHFHVPVSYYRSDSYSRYPYRGVYRDRGAEATVILSFPL